MGFPQPSLLWPLVTVDRRDVAESAKRARWTDIVFDHGPNRRSRSLRFQRNIAVTLVFEAVHLLRHDVARLAGAPSENLGVFKNRCPDFAVSIQAGEFAEL